MFKRTFCVVYEISFVGCIYQAFVIDDLVPSFEHVKATSSDLASHDDVIPIF